MIGTSVDEWLDGEHGLSVFRQEATAATGTLGAEVSHIEAFSHGDVGWGAACVRFTVPTGQTARTTFTAVFLLRDGVWKLVSAHNSVAVSDEDAFSTD